MIGIGIERIGIVSQSGYLDAVTIHQILHLAAAFLGEIRHVEVTDAGISPIGAAGRPAHQFDAGEPFLLCKCQHLLQR